jgi:hypothetical protein
VAEGTTQESSVRELVTQVKKDYQGRDEHIKAVRERRFREHDVQVPEAYTDTAAERRHSLIYDFLRRVPALIASALPVPVVKPRSETKEAQDTSSKIEKWATMAQVLMSGSRPVWTQNVDSVPATGYGVLKVALDRHLFGGDTQKDDESDEDYSERLESHRRKNFPFSWDHVPTDNFYVVEEDNNGIVECLEITRRKAAPILKRYGLKRDGRGNLTRKGAVVGARVSDDSAEDGTVEFVEHWTRTHVYYYVDGIKVGKTIKHDYGRVPYFVSFAQATSERDPKYASRSLADPLIEVQDRMDAMATMMENYTYLSSYPIPDLVKTDPQAPPLTSKANVTFGIGVAPDKPDGYELRFITLPPVGSDLKEFYAQLKEEAAQLSLAPILYGLAPGADTSGSALTTLIAVAKTIMGPGIDSIARQMGDAMGFVLELIETHLKADVPLYYEGDGKWMKIGPDDIKHYYEVQYELAPIIPAERAMRYNELSNAFAQGLATDVEVIEEGLGRPDPEQTVKGVHAMNLAKRPELQTMLIQQVMRDFGEALGMPQGQGTPASLPTSQAGFASTPSGATPQGAGGGAPAAPPPQQVPV